MKDAFKVGGTSIAGKRKKFLKRKFQLVYEFVNKQVLPKAKKRIVVSAVDLFFMECLSKFELISVPALMVEHMCKVVHVKEEKYRMPYGHFVQSF